MVMGSAKHIVKQYLVRMQHKLLHSLTVEHPDDGRVKQPKYTGENK
jgi:hypothetical protein